MADPTKLSYDPANVPQPVTTQDVYMHANLIEQRLIRMALTRIAENLDVLVASQQIPSVDTTKIAKAK